MTKKQVTDSLNKVPGWDIKTFNSNRKLHGGFRGFVDHVAINPKRGLIVFIEVKLGADRLSNKQIEYKSMLERVERNNDKFYYFVLTDKNLVDVLEWMARKA